MAGFPLVALPVPAVVAAILFKVSFLLRVVLGVMRRDLERRLSRSEALMEVEILTSHRY
jgi:hypothetical protein